MERITKHLRHYLTLLGILSVGFIAFWYFSYDINFQMAISVAIAASYVAWGIVHHYIHRDLTISVIIEYLVFASLGLVIMFSLIFRS